MQDDEGPQSPIGPTRQPKRMNWNLQFDPSRVEEHNAFDEMQKKIDNPTLAFRLSRLVQRRLRGPRGRAEQLWRATLPRWQRASRGWSDADWWTLDSHVCLHLGTLLTEQSRHAHSYPDALTYEEWTDQLRVAGEALLAFDPEDGERVGAAQEALRWVADNLTRLWD